MVIFQENLCKPVPKCVIVTILDFIGYEDNLRVMTAGAVSSSHIITTNMQLLVLDVGGDALPVAQPASFQATAY